MSAEKTLGLVIRHIEFSESSYIATLFTADFGKITGLAKGARRAKSAFENALDLLAISRVVFLRKPSDGLDLWTEAKLERRFHASSRDLRRLYAGYYIAELLQALTIERDPHPALFRIVWQTIVGLDGDAPIALSVLRFELNLLRELGHLPRLTECVECGRPLEGESRVALGLLAGGTLCGRCKMGQRHVVSLSAAAARLIGSLATETPRQEGTHVAPDEGTTTGNEQPPPPPVWPEFATAALCGELRGLMNQWMSHRLGKRPRLLPYLTR